MSALDLQPTLTGELLSLRPLQAADFEALCTVAADPAQTAGLWDAAQASAFLRELWQPEGYPGWPEFLDQLRARDLGT